MMMTAMKVMITMMNGAIIMAMTMMMTMTMLMMMMVVLFKV